MSSIHPGTAANRCSSVIPGWDQGVAGMKVGGRRKLVIPPHLAYGDGGAGGVIKPGETLVFVVDLVGVN
jgi:peptidylprolyl isomerase